jgi:hypothetical protein
MLGISVSHPKQPLHNMTAINRYAKICKWLNKWIVLVLFAVIILVTAAIAVFVSFAVPLLH